MADIAPITKKIIAFGNKQVFLPKFTIALVRTPQLSPYHARFLVPLNFSKFDLRDYLYHAYDVKCHKIRSFVKQGHVRDTEESPGHLFREKSKKYMTVEMERPFVWPEDPKSWEPWGKEEREESIRNTLIESGSKDVEQQRTEIAAMRDHARKILQGSAPPKLTVRRGEDADNGREIDAGSQKGWDKATVQERWEAARSPQMLGKRPSHSKGVYA